MSIKAKSNHRVRKGICYGLYALLGVVVLFIVLLAAAPDFMLKTVGFRTYIAHYDQMEPGIKQNALVFVNRVDIDQLGTNDLVTFQSNTDLNDNGTDDLVTGYLNRTTGTGESTYYYFRSEGSVGDWAVLQSNSIVGGYAFSIPVLGLIIDFIASPFGIAVICVNIAIITGIVFVVKTGKKEYKEVKTEEQA